MTTELIQVPFHSISFEAVARGEWAWASLRRLCEAVGVDFSSQLQKLKGKPWAVMAEIAITGSNGTYIVQCLRHDCIPLWAAHLNVNKIAPEVRELVTRLQLEARDVLAAHFFGRGHRARVEPIEVVGRFIEQAMGVLSLGGGLEPRDELLMKDFVRSRVTLSSSLERSQEVSVVDRAVALGYPRSRRRPGQRTRKGRGGRLSRQAQ